MSTTIRLREEMRLIDRRVITESGCWEWAGCRRNGYGRIWVDGKLRSVHRLAAHLWIDQSIELGGRDILVLHRCDNPPCFNPEHLFLGDTADNMRDMHDKGRWRPRSTPWPTVYPRTRDCEACGQPYEPDTDHRGRSVVCSRDCLIEWRRKYGQSRPSRATLTPDDVREIRRLLAAGGALGPIAAQFGVSKPAISNINTGKTWGHVR